jgi:hypothetical protein
MTTINPTYQPRVPPRHISVLEAHQDGIEKAINCCRIGFIQAFYPGTAGIAPATADILIAQQQVTSIDAQGNATLAPYPLLRSVPVVFPCGGGFTLTFPISPGDECLLVFNDRESDNWYINGAGQPPTTNRKHDLSDAFALVGVRSCPRALGAISTNSVQLRSDDGESYIELAAGNIVNVVAPGGINFNTPAFTVNGNQVVTGMLTGNGINLGTHKHTGVQPGSGNTGGPI